MSGRDMVGTIAVVVLCAVCCGRAAGSPVTFAFEGVVTSEVIDIDNVLGGQVTIGSRLNGTYTFESTAEPQSPGSSLYKDAITTISGTIASVPFLGPIGGTNIIGVRNDVIAGFDHYSIVIGVELASTEAFFSFGVRDPTGMMFSSNALPLIPPSLDGLDPNFSGFSIGTESERVIIRGDVTALVPEPATLALVITGALGLATRRLRTKR